MISLTTLLITAGLVLVLSFLYKQKNGKNLPPGPRGLPLLGNLLELGAMPQYKLTEWVGVYGKILKVNFGLKRLIVISDAKLIREAFNDPLLSGRMDNETFKIFTEGDYGITNSEGERWTELRRFTLRTLRELGFGKKSIMEGLIMDEVNDYMTVLKSHNGKPMAPQRRLNIAILNVIWGLLSAGTRISHDDPKYVEIFDKQKMLAEKLAFTFYVPSLSKLFPKLSGWAKLMEQLDEMRKIFVELIDDHKEKLVEDGSEPRDFIEAYLREMKAATNPKSVFYKEEGERNLRGVMTDFFGAGPDTSSATITWAVLYLTKFPHVQKKVQEELDKVIGKQRQPTLADKNDLPYVIATIEEVLRLSSIVPLGVFHKALGDVKFHGYDIPKGAWICHNQHYLQKSKDLWERADSFEPERHLMEDGKTIKRYENLMAFGNGKRVCVGETLARDAVFLFFTNIFQKFEVRLSDRSAHVTLEPLPGFVLPPQNYEIVLKDRF